MATKANKDKPKNATGECQCFTTLAFRVTAEDIPEADPVGFVEYDVYESCGRSTANTFAPGHDAKLKSLLVNLLAAGDEYNYRTGGCAIAESPLNRAKAFGWAAAVKDAAKIKRTRDAQRAKAEKAKEAARAKRTAEDLAREAARDQRRLERASALATPPSKRAALAKLTADVNAAVTPRPMTEIHPETTPEADCRVKIGRFTFDAVTLSEDVNEVTVSYWDQKDQVRSTRVKRAQILPLD